MTYDYTKTVIIGGGQCGVNLACWLQKEGESFLILEQSDQLLHQWYTKRWDSFQLNSPHVFTKFYGQKEDDLPLEETGFFFEQQRRLWNEHVQENKIESHCRLNFKVTGFETTQDPSNPLARFVIKGKSTTDSDAEVQCYLAHNVVICTGLYDKPKIPEISTKVPSEIVQQHSSTYQNAAQFPGDSVLVVGGGQSGVQIARDLQKNGKQVYLCTSVLPGVPRRYRGADLFTLLKRMGFLDMTNEQRDAMFPPEQSRAMKYGKLPILGATESISAFSLYRDGVQILGRLKDIREDKLILEEDRIKNVQASLDGYRMYRGMLSARIDKQPEGTYPPAEPDPVWDHVEQELLDSNGPLEVPLDDIQGIVWATGYETDLSWLPHANDLDPVRHTPATLSSATTPGLYYSGFPWLRTIQSVNIIGFNGDHEIITDMIVNENSTLVA